MKWDSNPKLWFARVPELDVAAALMILVKTGSFKSAENK